MIYEFYVCTNFVGLSGVIGGHDGTASAALF